MLAQEIVADLHPDDASRFAGHDGYKSIDRDPRQTSDAEALCRAYFHLLYEADPCEYRQLQQKALVSQDAQTQLTRLYSPEKVITCLFLEVPLCEYKEHIYSADIPMRTRVFIDNTCRAAGISDRMRLADVWSALLKSSKETYLAVKYLHDGVLNGALMRRSDSSAFQLRRVLPLIEFFVSPMASAAKEATHDAGEQIIHTNPVTRKEFNYENK